MKEKRRQFDKAFKVSAVELLERSDKPLELVARELGISGSMLRRWRDQVRLKGVGSFSDAGRQERAEVLRLRRENKDLRRQIEVLKKTFGFQVRPKKKNTKR
jgi:transposase